MNPQDSEFWKDIPDHMLETIYGQLREHRSSSMTAPNTSSAGQASIATDDHEEHELERNNSLPPLFFPSPSIPAPSFSLSGDLSVDLFSPTLTNTMTPPVEPGAAVFAPSGTLDAGPISFASLTAMSIKQESHTSDSELAKARSIIQQSQQLVAIVQPLVTDMYPHQLQLLLLNSPDTGLLKSLQAQQAEYIKQLDACQSELSLLKTHLILHVSELSTMRLLAHRLQLLKLKLELLHQELSWKLDPAQIPPAGNSVLYLEDQPLPQVIFKEKTIEDAFQLRLITGAATGLDQFGLVQAEVTSDEQQYWRTEKPLSSHQTTLDPGSLSAVFNKLKIHVSTRMSLVNLRFVINFHHQFFGQCQASSSVYPLIVITNESQWCDAEGKLIIHDAFGPRKEIEFPTFANILHLHFLKSTRQSFESPRRALCLRDWHFIHHRYFDTSPMVSQPQVAEFWTWFGGLVQTLRFKRHINSLWFDGLIFGIISKEQCSEELQPHEVGTFLIRFSETYAGLFAVAYVSDDPFERVKHYLIKPEDTGSQKTLPDFLREKPQFQYLLKLDAEQRTLTRLSKDSALAQFYSKERILKPAGYVLL